MPSTQGQSTAAMQTYRQEREKSDENGFTVTHCTSTLRWVSKCFAVCVFLYVSWVFKIRYKFPLTTMRIGSWRKGGMRGVEARRLMAFCRGRRPRLRLPGVARTGGVGGAWPLRRGAEVRLARRSSQKILRRHSSLEWLLPQARPAPSMLVGGVGRSLALRWPAVPAGCVGTGRRFSGGGQRRALGP